MATHYYPAIDFKREVGIDLALYSGITKLNEHLFLDSVRDVPCQAERFYAESV